MEIELYYKSDREYYTLNESGNRTEIDMLPKEEKKAMSPTELLLSGLVACAAVDIVSMVKKRRRTFVDITGKVIGKRRDEQPRKFLEIHVHYVITSPDLTEDEALRFVELGTTKYCSVAATINESTKLTHSVQVKRP